MRSQTILLLVLVPTLQHGANLAVLPSPRFHLLDLKGQKGPKPAQWVVESPKLASRICTGEFLCEISEQWLQANNIHDWPDQETVEVVQSGFTRPFYRHYQSTKEKAMFKCLSFLHSDNDHFNQCSLIN